MPNCFFSLKSSLKLGMGKPLGMGAVNIESELYINNCKNRYDKLFSNNQWETGETKALSQDFSNVKNNFEEYLKAALQYQENYSAIPRIKQLLAMLNWNENPSANYLDERRYMEIERQQKPCIGNNSNEYKARCVLPTPLQIVLQDNQATSSSKSKLQNSSQQSKTQENTQPSEIFFEGQTVDAKVVDLKEEQIQKGKNTQLRTFISYEISSSDCLSIEEINKEKVSLNIGDIVKVSIVKVQEISIRKVKRIKS